MFNKKLKLFVTGLLILLLASTQLSAAASGKITGKVTGKDDGEPLFAANVFLLGTAIGAATDIYGKFEIKGIPAGTYILKVSYLGLEEELRTVDVTEGQVQTQNFELSMATIEGEAVVITAQAAGQKSAINRQLTAKKIMSIVSSEKIQEMPDANAAESVGRLPGISIQRKGGEGNKLVIRGLEPKYNSIQLNGIRLSPTGHEDRSVDLSMISPYMLDGIEVSKNVTPDQDADVLGGTVNFKIRKAGGASLKEELTYKFLSQGSYNNLSSSHNKNRNYKFIGGVEGRFFNGNLGALFLIDQERKNLTSDEMGMVAKNDGDNKETYKLTRLNLYNIPRDRERTNLTLVLDYKIPDGSIVATNYFNHGITEEIVRQELFGLYQNQHIYTMNYSKVDQKVFNSTIQYEQSFTDLFDINFSFAYNSAISEDPNNWGFDFVEASAINNTRELKDADNLDPRVIPTNARNDFSTTEIQYLRTGNSKYDDKSYHTSLDLEKKLNISKELVLNIKAGGKYTYTDRSFDQNISNGGQVSLTSATGIQKLIEDNFGSRNISSFTDDSYDFGNYLDGDYTLVAPLSFEKLNKLAEFLKENKQTIEDLNSGLIYTNNDYLSGVNDYTGNERLAAYYGMFSADIGDLINIVAGVRVQDLKTEYTAAQGASIVLPNDPFDHRDSTFTKIHNHVLPALTVRIKPVSWLDLRLAYTETISYPDFQAITPKIDMIGFTKTIYWNNADLNATESQNFDAYLSYHDNYIGLLTLGGFYKNISNQIYFYEFRADKTTNHLYIPDVRKSPGVVDKSAYKIFTYLNNPNDTKLWGIELDWQTHLWYLPEPFNSIILNVNYTHTESESKYPFNKRISSFPIKYEEQIFEDRLLTQPDDILNLSVGYDYKDFSFRLSYLYQADIFARVDFWPNLRETTAPYSKWDISVKQKLPWYGLQVFMLLNNISNEKDSNVLQMFQNIPTSIESYGMTTTFGIRFEL